jgi:hypothetical protein
VAELISEPQTTHCSSFASITPQKCTPKRPQILRSSKVTSRAPTGSPKTSQSRASATGTAMSSPRNTELVGSPASWFLSTTRVITPMAAGTKLVLVVGMEERCTVHWRKLSAINDTTISMINRSSALPRAAFHGEFAICLCALDWSIFISHSGKRFHSQRDLAKHQCRPH